VVSFVLTCKMSDTSGDTTHKALKDSSGDYRSELERKAVRKLDLTILPILTMFYLLSFLVRSFFMSINNVFYLTRYIQDRANIGQYLSEMAMTGNIFIQAFHRKCSCRWLTKRIASYGPPISDLCDGSLCVRSNPALNQCP